MGTKQDERTAARDFVMARLAACLVNLEAAKALVQDTLGLMVTPEEDDKGKQRAQNLEAIDDAIGLAATSVQSAQGEWEEVDPKEGEPDFEDDEDDGDDEDERRR
jgi:hypothetical protein